MFEEFDTELIDFCSDYVGANGSCFADFEDGPAISVCYFVLALLDIDGLFALGDVRLIVKHLDHVLVQLDLALLVPRFGVLEVASNVSGGLYLYWEFGWWRTV
jgi:hypothetical protein